MKRTRMERELIITVKKDSVNDEEKITREVECIKTLFPYLESFETFATCNQVFDLENHNIVYANKRLKSIFNKGVQTNNSFIVSLN